MKTITIFIIFLISNVLFFAQNIAFVDFLPEDKGDNINIKQINGDIWVRDSIYYYSYFMSNWSLTKKYKVISRDDKGRIKTALTTKLDSSQNMVNCFLTKVDYYDNDILRDSLILGWNNNLELWNDTIFYLKKDIRGNMLDSIVSFFETTMSGQKRKRYYRTIKKYNDEFQMIFSGHYHKTNRWINVYDETFRYNEDKLLEEHIIHNYSYFDEDYFIPEEFYRYIYNYDIYGNTIENIYQRKWKEDENWKNKGKFIFEYNQNKSFKSKIHLVWNKDLGDWEKVYLDKYYYENNLIVEDSIWYWNSENTGWDKEYVTLYKYKNSLITSKISKHFEQDSFIVHSKLIYEYDNLDSLIHKQLQYWDMKNNKWLDEYEYIKEFNDAGMQTLYIYLKKGKKVRKWINEFDQNQRLIKNTSFGGNDNNEWVNAWQYEILYNEDNTKITVLSRLWDVIGGKWGDSSKKTRYYDDYGNLIRYIFERNESNHWEKRQEIVYFWSKFNTNGLVNSNDNNIILFPNPATDHISFLNQDAGEKLKIYIYSMQGELLESKETDSDEKMDVSNLETGIYLLKIENKNKILKLIIHRN